MQKKSKNKSKPKIKVVNVGKVPFERIMVNLSKMDSVLKASKCFGTREVKNVKETKGGETKRTKVKAFVAKKAVNVSASLIPRKEKGLMISAIDEVGDHESEVEKDSGKKKGGRKPPVSARKVPVIVKK